MNFNLRDYVISKLDTMIKPLVLESVNLRPDSFQRFVILVMKDHIETKEAYCCYTCVIFV